MEEGGSGELNLLCFPPENFSPGACFEITGATDRHSLQGMSDVLSGGHPDPTSSVTPLRGDTSHVAMEAL